MHHIPSRSQVFQLSLEAQLFTSPTTTQASALEREFDILLQRFLAQRDPEVFKGLKTLCYWQPELLATHKEKLLRMVYAPVYHRVKWKLALLISHLPLTTQELNSLKNHFRYWALNPNAAKSIRVNALQALHDLASNHKSIEGDFQEVLDQMRGVKSSSIEARVKALTGFEKCLIKNARPAQGH